jgi:hypothetical protein
LGVAQKLNSYNIDPASLTVSGISSGGAFAIQYHVANSGSVFGAGVTAGPPYWCAQDSATIALSSCTQYPSLISLTALYAATEYAYVVNSIDDPSLLQNSRVWLFSGTLDQTVYPGVMQKTYGYYQHYISKSSQIVFISNVPANHAWITNNYGSRCNYFGSPYINNCNFDNAGQMLQHFYGNLSGPTNKTQPLLKFTQGYYTPGSINPATISLAPTGYVYVPSGCQKGKLCKLHIAFHGCLMGPDSIQDTFAQNSGLNQWAESNNIIVVYPQVIKTNLPYNPEGCWDWWGYTGAPYATKLAPQIKFVSNVIAALEGQA